MDYRGRAAVAGDDFDFTASSSEKLSQFPRHLQRGVGNQATVDGDESPSARFPKSQFTTWPDTEPDAGAVTELAGRRFDQMRRVGVVIQRSFKFSRDNLALQAQLCIITKMLPVASTASR